MPKNDQKFDISNVTEEELEQIKSKILQGLAERSKEISSGKIHVGGHDSHYSTHSSTP